MLDKFFAYLNKTQLIPHQSTTLLAVSGGVDSVVLLHLFKRARLSFAIAHCHFGLRGEKADEDQLFVRQLATKYAVPFYTKDFPTKAYAKRHKLSIQMAARKLRYTWFQQLLAQHNLQQVATAHHIDDEFETFLYNLTKGTSISGLHGILPKHANIVRPLGFATKKEIVEYAKEQNLSWREDTSNASLRYQRNWLRHKVIPQLKSINPNLENTFVDTITKLRQVEQVFMYYSQQLKQIAFHHIPPYYYLDFTKLEQENCPTIVIFEWLRPFGFSFPSLQKWHETMPQPGKRLYTSTHWLLADRACWVVGAREHPDKHSYILFSDTRSIITPAYAMQIDKITKDQSYHIPTSSAVAALDADKLSFPLQLRLWRAGDIFFPLGMSHRKKLSDFFIDQKIPLHLKEKTNVLTSGNAIVWVVGYRIDDRFKLTNLSEKVYQITLSHSQFVVTES